jgi:hypothetical protein
MLVTMEVQRNGVFWWSMLRRQKWKDFLDSSVYEETQSEMNLLGKVVVVWKLAMNCCE